VNTQMTLGTYSLNIFPIGSSTSSKSLSVFVIASGPGFSLFSFVFDPTADTTPSGLYNLALTAQSRTTSMVVSVFDPVVSAICLGVVNSDGATSDTCSINAMVGGVVSLRLNNFASGLVNAGDLAFSISKIDGTPISSLKPQLSVFSGTDKPLSLNINKYTINTDFSNGQLALLLNVALVSSPATSVTLPIVLRLNPQVVSVDFSESLVSLTVSMNQPVIPKVSPTNCSNIFSTATIAKFGNNPLCRFSSGSTIFVEFGNDESIVTGDKLSILPGSIVPSDRFPISNVALSPAVAAVPLTFKKPSVDIRGTQYVESCAQANPAFIYAIANSPRPFVSINWRCVSPQCSTDTSLNDFLSSRTALSVSIPAVNIRNSKCLSDSKCAIVVTVVDFLNRKTDSAPFNVYSNPGSAPDLQFLPLDQDRYTSDMLVVLKTRFKFSACSGDTVTAPIFSWSISPSSGSIVSPVPNVSSVTSPRLVLPANSLRPLLYDITATASIDGDSASASVQLRIVQRDIFASISAPNFVSSSSNIVLDASKSRDLETSITSSPTLLYSWACIFQNQPCLNSAGTQLLLPQKSSANSTITIFANTLTSGITANQSAKFVFKVDVSNSADPQRIGSSVAEVSIVLDAIPSIYAAASSDNVNVGSSLPVGLSAVVVPNQPNLAIVWSEVSGLLTGGINSVLDPAFIDARSSTIVINSFLLAPGLTYIFQAMVENNPRATDTVSIFVNPAPSSGKCYVASVQTGTAATSSCRIADKCSILSRVTVSCESWMDDNLPLAYQFGYRQASGAEIRFDYIRESSSSFQLPNGNQNLFVDVCDSKFACSTFSSFNENPLIITLPAVGDLTAKQVDSLDPLKPTSEVSKSVQTGDVDAFSKCVGVSISYFLQPAPSLPSSSSSSNRRLLITQQGFVVATAKQILDLARTVGLNDIGAANALIQPALNLVQASRTFDSASFTSLITSVAILGPSFSSPQSTDSQRKTAATDSANFLSSVSNADALKTGTNFQDVKKIETSIANALLQGAQPGIFRTATSKDSAYGIIATYVALPAKSQRTLPVSIQPPSLAVNAKKIEFELTELNVVDSSSVSVRSSIVPKAKYAATVTQAGNVLLSDVADCTVVKSQNAVPLKMGPELGNVKITIPFDLADGTGVGSAAALSTDLSSFKIWYYDETVSPPVWKNDCSGQAQATGAKSAVFVATCSHLTTFGIIAEPPKDKQPDKPGPVPVPSPPSPPADPTKQKPVDPPPSSPEEGAAAEFPLWAIILIPVVGGVSLLSAGGFFAYKRIHNVRVRAKQIVAASAWKSFHSATTISKPPPRPPANAVKTDNVGASDDGSPKREQQPVAKSARISKPDTPQSPSVTSVASSSSVKSRRQQLADLAAAEAANAVEFEMRQPALSPVMSSRQLAHVASRRVPFTAATSPQRRRAVSPASSDTRSNLSSASLRRQQLADMVIDQSTRSPVSQISPTRLPSRMSPSEPALSRGQRSPYSASPPLTQSGGAVRSRSASRSQRVVASAFSAETSPEPAQESPNVSYRARSPLPSTRNRAISPIETGRLGTESPSVHLSRFGSANFERYQSQSPPTSRASASPTYAAAPSLISSAAHRSTSRPGFRKPSSPQQQSGSRYDQA
jgi:hypothetical protein